MPQQTIHAIDAKPGMVVRYDEHWMGPVTAEVVAVEPTANGVMLQTTKGPIALDAIEHLALVR